MLRHHAVEALAAAAVALLITLVIASPVVGAPSERIFGAEIVGRHHDPFSVMQQFASPQASSLSLGLYSQPVTDLAGAALARAAGAVAAYNWLVLLSFPLSAAAAYLLARHLAMPRAGAMLAALLFAFSPFHLAQAAYHPHVAQTQWIPLYLLALWRCVDQPRWLAVMFLIAATMAVTLSNFYGGLIAAVITPFALGVYWFARARFAPRANYRLGVTLGALALLVVAGLAFVSWAAPAVLGDRAALAFPREELFRYSATWWGYFLPPVAHPLLGGWARQIWSTSGVTEGLLEQQVSLGSSVVALGLVAIWSWTRPADRRSLAVSAVPMLAAVALVAFVSSLSPERTVFGVTLVRPSALLYPIVPMFRSYARFGVVVQLMAVLLAGVGASWLLARGTRAARALCTGLVMLAIAEYAVWPPALARDVLPTSAHRWVMRQAEALRVIDCAPVSPESLSVSWLTQGRIGPLDSTLGDCGEPHVADKLAAAGVTHVIVHDARGRRLLEDLGDREGFQVQARFADADLLALLPRAPLVYTQHITGFWPREYDGDVSWRWMGTDATWTIVTPAPSKVAEGQVTLEIDVAAFHVRRSLTVRLDDTWAQTLDIDQYRRTYRIGPLALAAGTHQLTFQSATPATVADEVLRNGDTRALSFAMGAWKWSAQ